MSDLETLKLIAIYLLCVFLLGFLPPILMGRNNKKSKKEDKDKK